MEGVAVATAQAVAAAGGRALVACAGGAMEADLEAAGGQLRRLPLHARDPASLILNGLRLARLVRREGVEVMHVRSRAPAFSALLAGRLTGAPLVATYHGVYSARGPLKRAYNSVMTRGAAVIANSAFTERHILQQHGRPRGALVVIPEGVDTARFDPAAVTAPRLAQARRILGADADPRPRLLLAARLTGWKGQAVAIEAMADPRLAGAVLVLAGRTQSEAHLRELRRRAEERGLAERVRFTGPVDDMPAILAACDVVLAPSTRAESFGRSVAEALAMGAPVVASDLGAHAETVGASGWLTAPGDPAALAAAAAQALALDGAARLALGAAARTRIVREFSQAAMTDATLDLYRRLADRTGADVR